MLHYDTRLNLYIDNVLSKAMHYDTVITGALPLVFYGLVTSSWNNATLFVTEPELEGINAYGLIAYKYISSIDTTNYVQSSPLTKHIYIPTVERALIELIRDDCATVLESELLEALCNYTTENYYNYDLLLEVATHFDVSKSKLDYWLEEARRY